MAYSWSSELETGNRLIDDQHKQIILAMNGFLEACARGQGRAETGKTLKFLYEYTAKHFADEEKLQRDSDYPDYESHKKYHDDFKRSVLLLAREFEEKGPTITMVGKINSGVGSWLISHIKREDTKVASHIKAREK